MNTAVNIAEQEFTVEDFTVSNNDKTDKSANFSLHTCRPTPYCLATCYSRGRTQAEAEELGFGSSANGGPITWQIQRACYERNVKVVQYFVRAGRVHELAEYIARKCAKVEIGGEVRRYIRWNGCGDLFPEVLPLIIALAEHGVRSWGFSRKAELIAELGFLADAVGLTGWARPFFHASIDVTTKPADRTALQRATAKLNGRAALATATGNAEDALALDDDNVDVHFGYHSNLRKTVLGTTKECPATAGDHIVCKECLRCFGLGESHGNV